VVGRLWRLSRLTGQPVFRLLETLDSQTAKRFGFSNMTDGRAELESVGEAKRKLDVGSLISLVFVPEYVGTDSASLLQSELVSLADEQWLLFVTETDQLPKGFVVHLERQLAQWPETSVVTLDEWFVEGNSLKPLCKPEWDETMLWAQPYLGRGVLFSKKVFMALGGFQPETPSEHLDGVLDDWLLSWSAHSEAAKRTRRVTGWPLIRSSAPQMDVTEQRVSRVQAVLKASEPGCVVSARSGLPNILYVQWPLPKPAPLVTLIVPTRNGLDVLKPCVEHIIGLTDYPCLQLVVVDNDSDCPDTQSYLNALPKRDSRVRVIQWSGAFNFAAINNSAVQQAKGEWVCLLNNDIEPNHPQWLTEMMRLAVRPGVGCVGSKLLYPDGRIQHAGVVLGVGGVAGHSHRLAAGNASGYMNRLQVPQQYSAVTAACLVVRKALYEQVGGLDARAFPINYNDIDLCLKIKDAGYTNLWTPDAVLTHHESLTRGRGARGLKRWKALAEARRFKRKWRHYIENDPAYHPDLTPFTEGFELNPTQFSTPEHVPLDPD